MHGNPFTEVRILGHDDILMRPCIFPNLEIRSGRETERMHVARSRERTAESLYQFTRDVLIE